MARWTEEDKQTLNFNGYQGLSVSGEHDFNESVKNGDLGEFYAKRFLEKQYLSQPENVRVDIKDVHDVPHYQRKGIDLLVDVYKQNGSIHRILFEIKNDSYTTNNLFAETVSNAETGTKGCVFTSEAHWWLYIYENQDRAIMFNPKELADFVKNTTKTYRKVTLMNTTSITGQPFKTYGVLIPVQDVVKYVPSAREIRIPIRAMAKELGIDMKRFDDFKKYKSCIDGEYVEAPYPLGINPTDSLVLN